jgi:glutathione-specific gamma-glutamylcyclotransferase
MAETQPDLWIFAYGSLMWRPDFAYAERHRAELVGYHRSLCIESHLYRGTPERPGLVFGLDRGGSCVGVAFRIAPELAAPTLEAVRLRELVLHVYREVEAAVRLDDGRSVTAIAYVADPTHPSYVGGLDHAAMLAIVRDRAGASGSNADYVRNTQAHLLELGVHDPVLAGLCAELDGPQGNEDRPPVGQQPSS